MDSPAGSWCQSFKEVLNSKSPNVKYFQLFKMKKSQRVFDPIKITVMGNNAKKLFILCS